MKIDHSICLSVCSLTAIEISSSSHQDRLKTIDFTLPKELKRRISTTFVEPSSPRTFYYKVRYIDLQENLADIRKARFNSMAPIRIVPWYDERELEKLKEWFYNKELHGDKRIRAVQRVKSYQSRGSQYLPHVIDSTAQLTNSILLDEERVEYDKISVKLSYTMSLIRFVNGILDPTQQSQFAIPLHTLAKRTGLPSWFVDLRHWGTHERELPSLEMLRIAAKEALLWLWDHYWNDTELEEEEPREEPEVDEVTLSLQQVIQRGRVLGGLLKEYHWYWEEDPVNLISSSNFEAEEESTHFKRRRKLSPQELIKAFIADCRDAWDRINHRKKFVEIFIQQYSSTLLRVFIMKLPGFDRDFLSWILQNFKEQLANPADNLLRLRFKTLELLERKVFCKFVSIINSHRFVEAWTSSWEPLISDNPSLLSYKFCQLMSSRLAHDRDNFNNKRKKRVLSSQEVESSLSHYIDKYSQYAWEASSYNSQVQIGSRVEAVAPSDNDTTDILKDIESLKKRHMNLISKKLWDPHPDWSPRPFGIL